MVWSRFDGNHYRIQGRRLAASGSLGPIQTLSAAGGDAFHPQVAIDPNGNALVAWSRFDGYTNRVQLRRRSASGDLSPVQTLSAAGSDSYGPRIAIDANGNALVVWTGSDGDPQVEPYRIQGRRRSSSGGLGPIEALSLPNAHDPQLAIDATGNALVVWSRDVSGKLRIQVRRRSSSGSLSDARTLSAAGADAYRPQVAIDANGNALVVWSRLGLIELRRRSASSGALSTVQTLSKAGRHAELPQVAINRNGNALVVWQLDNGYHWKVQMRRRSAAGRLNDVQTLSPAGMDAYRPALAIDARNGAWVIWQLYDGSANSVQVRHRTNRGHLERIQTLSDPGPRASGPPVAIDADRIVLAAWSEYDGTSFRIRAAQLAP